MSQEDRGWIGAGSYLYIKKGILSTQQSNDSSETQAFFWLKIYLDANPNIVLHYHAETHADGPFYCISDLFPEAKLRKMQN